ncbi:Fibronectin-binding protein PlpA [Bienertia sinuspersici]
MDRSWMNHNGVKDRRKPKYIAGVNEFLHFAFTGKSDETMLKCPCLNCRFVLSQNRKNMHCHLLVYGIDPTYNPWVSHGESIQEIDNDEEGYVGEVSDNESDHMPLDDMAPFAKYDLPEKVAGADVTEALSFQCSMLYKHWRFRLKEQHFRDKSLVDAINSRPNNIDVGPWTKVNTKNKLKQTETPANGARLMRHQLNQLKNLMDRLSLMKLNKILCTSPYLRRQKRSGWEPNAEKDYEALKRLHEKEVEKHGEDTLSVKDAYMEVFKQKSGYVKGLGPGARPPKKCRADGESNEARTSLSLEIQKLKDDAAAREASLASEIETLKASNDELKTSNEELIASNDEIKATVSRINIEAIKREKKLRDDMMKMFEQMRYVTFVLPFIDIRC